MNGSGTGMARAVCGKWGRSSNGGTPPSSKRPIFVSPVEGDNEEDDDNGWRVKEQQKEVGRGTERGAERRTIANTFYW